MTPELQYRISDLKDAIMHLGVKDSKNCCLRIAELSFTPEEKIVVVRFNQLVEQIEREEKQCVKTTE